MRVHCAAPAYGSGPFSNAPVDGPGSAPGSVPVVYLPGYARSDVRAVEDADARLKPVAEFQYRGCIFSQQNGRDWTLAAFLESKQGGLGIHVADDQATRDALLRARLKLMAQSVEELRRRAPLRPPSSTLCWRLIWTASPALDGRSGGFPGRATAEQWDAFAVNSPTVRDRMDAGEIEVAGPARPPRGPMGNVWDRYADAPRATRWLPRLRAAAPKRRARIRGSLMALSDPGLRTRCPRGSTQARPGGARRQERLGGGGIS